MSDTSNLESILSQILSELSEIKSILSIGSDQIKSNQSNQIRSDLIRSDQISKNHSNWMELFVEALELYGIDYAGIELASVESGANYYLSNQKKIASKKGYLKKVISSATPCKSKETTAKTPPPQQKPSKHLSTPQNPDTDILGVPKEIVESKRHLFTASVFEELKAFLDDTYLRYFGSYEKIIVSDLRLNIAVAMSINNKLL